MPLSIDFLGVASPVIRLKKEEATCKCNCRLFRFLKVKRKMKIKFRRYLRWL